MPYHLFYQPALNLTPVVEVTIRGKSGRFQRGFSSIREAQKYIRGCVGGTWFGDFSRKEIAILARNKAESLKHLDDKPKMADACLCVGDEILQDGVQMVSTGYFWLKWED